MACPAGRDFRLHFYRFKTSCIQLGDFAIHNREQVSAAFLFVQNGLLGQDALCVGAKFIPAIKIDLQSNRGLTGPIPTLGGLAMLEKLLLHDNDLTGQVPSEVGLLSNLVELNLEFNRLNGISIEDQMKDEILD